MLAVKWSRTLESLKKLPSVKLFAVFNVFKSARQCVGKEPFRPILQLIMYVRGSRVARTAEPSQQLTLLNPVSDLGDDGMRLEVRHHAEFTISMIDYDVVAGVPSLRKLGHEVAGIFAFGLRLVRPVAAGKHNNPICRHEDRKSVV